MGRGGRRERGGSKRGCRCCALWLAFDRCITGPENPQKMVRRRRNVFEVNSRTHITLVFREVPRAMRLMRSMESMPDVTDGQDRTERTDRQRITLTSYSKWMQNAVKCGIRGGGMLAGEPRGWFVPKTDAMNQPTKAGGEEGRGAYTDTISSGPPPKMR